MCEDWLGKGFIFVFDFFISPFLLYYLGPYNIEQAIRRVAIFDVLAFLARESTNTLILLTASAAATYLYLSKSSKRKISKENNTSLIHRHTHGHSPSKLYKKCMGTSKGNKFLGHGTQEISFSEVTRDLFALNKQTIRHLKTENVSQLWTFWEKRWLYVYFTRFSKKSIPWIMDSQSHLQVSALIRK